MWKSWQHQSQEEIEICIEKPKIPNLRKSSSCKYDLKEFDFFQNAKFISVFLIYSSSFIAGFSTKSLLSICLQCFYIKLIQKMSKKVQPKHPTMH